MNSEKLGKLRDTATKSINICEASLVQELRLHLDATSVEKRVVARNEALATLEVIRAAHDFIEISDKTALQSNFQWLQKREELILAKGSKRAKSLLVVWMEMYEVYFKQVRLALVEKRQQEKNILLEDANKTVDLLLSVNELLNRSANGLMCESIY